MLVPRAALLWLAIKSRTDKFLRISAIEKFLEK